MKMSSSVKKSKSLASTSDNSADKTPKSIENTENVEKDDTPKTFKELGVVDPICEAADALGWKHATPIQAETLSVAFSNRDIIGLAETGSGKTAAFTIPVLQGLLENPSKVAALVLAPTRELAFQIAEQFDALGGGIGVKTAVIIGGVDMMTQAIALARKPHVIIGTPGRIVDHLQNTKGFSLRSIRYLILDEADRMLSLDFEEAINTILASLPRENRRTFLFSATMTSKVAKLQRASLNNPVRVEVSDKYGTVSTLVQQYLFTPAKYKDSYLAYVLNEFAGQSSIIFAATCSSVQKITGMLCNLGFTALSLHGQMSQSKRLGALARFKSGTHTILVATDVASRGLDIPAVDLVLNFDVPSNGKDYIHRVGRTARAGRSGRAITYVTQYDIELYQRIETLIGQKLEAFPVVEEAALLLSARVSEAARIAAMDIREAGGVGRKRNADVEDEGDETSSAAAIVNASQRRRQAVGKSVVKRGRNVRRG